MIKAMVETPQAETEFVKWQFEDIENRINANVEKMSQRGEKTKRNETNVIMLHVSSIAVLYLKKMTDIFLILECHVEPGHTH